VVSPTCLIFIGDLIFCLMVAEIVILLIVMFPIILRIFRAVRSLCVELVFGVGVSLDNMVTLGVRFLTLVLEAVGEVEW
jgi:hypothetical protein